MSIRTRGPRLTRSFVVTTGIAASLALAGTTAAQWVQATAPDLTGAVLEVPVTGRQAAPAVLALALVGVAASLASALSSAWVRWVTGPVLLIAGLVASVLSVGVYLDPGVGARAAVASATGVLGGDLHATAGTWPLIAALPAGIVAAAGAVVLAVGGRWQRSSRHRSAAVDVASRTAILPQEDPAAAWDALTRGEDPTVDRGQRHHDDMAE